ncbi:hypothetical protein NOK06_06160 [Neorhizobium galegae]|nr:hypothetical protein F4V90_00715 [Neorhizobium galegae]MCQ1805948.1 hypothetical protein [Neorhizobium galegae]
MGFIGQGEHKIISGVAGAAGRQNSCESASQNRDFSNSNTERTPLFLRSITTIRLSKRDEAAIIPSLPRLPIFKFYRFRFYVIERAEEFRPATMLPADLLRRTALREI